MRPNKKFYPGTPSTICGHSRIGGVSLQTVDVVSLRNLLGQGLDGSRISQTARSLGMDPRRSDLEDEIVRLALAELDGGHSFLSRRMSKIRSQALRDLGLIPGSYRPSSGDRSIDEALTSIVKSLSALNLACMKYDLFERDIESHTEAAESLSQDISSGVVRGLMLVDGSPGDTPPGLLRIVYGDAGAEGDLKVSGLPEALDLLHEVAQSMGCRVGRLPAAASSSDPMTGVALVAMGLPVTGTAPAGTELLFGKVAQELFHGHLTGDVVTEVERRRWSLGLDDRTDMPDLPPATVDELAASARHGARTAVALARYLLALAIDKRGEETALDYPETAYGIPTAYAWLGHERLTLGLAANMMTTRAEALDPTEIGVTAAIALDVIEALRYLDDDAPFDGTGFIGFVPDKVLRSLGISLVDETIPGAAVLMGRARDPEGLRSIVRECRSKGMLIMATDDIIQQMRELGIQMGLDMMLYPLGRGTQVIHAINFAVRAALSFGGIGPGDADRLKSYMAKRPKVFVYHMGPVDALSAAAAFAAIAHGALVIADMEVEIIPGALMGQPDNAKAVQDAIEVRGIQVRLPPVDLPVSYGPAFEGEVIRRPVTHVEAGGGRSESFELLRISPMAEDGLVTVIGQDADTMEAGTVTPLAILVEVYGRDMQPDFEGVMERRIHQFVNYTEGAWHTGQRDMVWIRLSRDAVSAGLRFEHLGEAMVRMLKDEFGSIVTRVQVTIVTHPERVTELHREAVLVYAERDHRLRDLSDENVDTFYTCTLCQSFAPDHVCIVTPERIGLCGAINWLDAKASSQISPNGPNQPISKGTPIDPVSGQWEGINDTVMELSHRKVAAINLYTLMDLPMTACGCFEAIVAMTADVQAVIVVSREFSGMTPIGMKFSTLAGSIGGGKQTPGFIGIGRRYLLSSKVIPADGGFLRIAWMPRSLKESMRTELQRRAEDLEHPDFLDKVADETMVTTAEELMTWMVERNHPALGMPPLLS